MNKYYYQYIRHLILPDIGIEGQDYLFKSRILCVGAGGLGSSALIHLAHSGIGSIGVIDFDVVDISNLNRQIIFNINDIGKRKVICVKNYLKNINTFLNIHIYDFKLSTSNCFDIMKNYDLILDCTDNLKSRFLINDSAVKLNIPMIHGSVFGLEGFVGFFHEACYRCLYLETPEIECINYGILGAVAGIIGTIQALETIKFLIKKQNTKISKLFFFDFKNLNLKFIKIKKNPKCITC